MYDKLPKPTASGHYFFGPGAGTCGAIMRIRGGTKKADIEKHDKWMASTGDRVLFDADNSLSAYETPQDALEAIRHAVAKDAREKKRYGANR
jgi:hypothetical protein